MRTWKQRSIVWYFGIHIYVFLLLSQVQTIDRIPLMKPGIRALTAPKEKL